MSLSNCVVCALLISIIYSCTSEKVLNIHYYSPEIAYSGRVDSTEGGVNLYWSGTSIKMNFEGQSVSALLKDDLGDNYYNVILDEDSMYILRPDTSKRFYQLASDLPDGKHTIELFKRTEWDRGTSIFYAFRVTGGASKLLPNESTSERQIEFYGNSITAGYAVEDTSGKDSPDSTYTNNYVSYAAITARHFQADYQCICRSGIGIMVSWFPLIMPELYDRLNPNDPESNWDFSLYTPDIVVVNLFQNDSWLVNMKGSEEFKLRFGDEAPNDEQIIKAYQNFILKLRTEYPQAKIICSLGCMDAAKEGSKWIEYVRTAVDNMKDTSIYTHIMPYIEASAHPSIADQEEMANSIIGFIEDNIEWK